METIHLKASSKKNMIEALRKAGFLFDEESGKLITATQMKEGKGYFISLCGILLAETGIILKDGDGNEYAEKEAIGGFHANLRCNDAELLDGVNHLVIDVESPLIRIA
jgi:hypothetical protein